MYEFIFNLKLFNNYTITYYYLYITMIITSKPRACDFIIVSNHLTITQLIFFIYDNCIIYDNCLGWYIPHIWKLFYHLYNLLIS